MKMQLTELDFIHAFAMHGSCYKANFSYEGKKALFQYIEEVEEGTGEQIELDIVALCCEFAEYDSLDAWRDDYSIWIDQDCHTRNVETLDDLNDYTTVIPVEGDRFIIQIY